MFLFTGSFDKVILLPVLVVQMLSELIKKEQNQMPLKKSKYEVCHVEFNGS
jgi:hypothetical protein